MKNFLLIAFLIISVQGRSQTIPQLADSLNLLKAKISIQDEIIKVMQMQAKANDSAYKARLVSLKDEILWQLTQSASFLAVENLNKALARLDEEKADTIPDQWIDTTEFEGGDLKVPLKPKIKQVTQAQRLAMKPYEGKLVYQYDGVKGWYGFENNTWKQIATK